MKASTSLVNKTTPKCSYFSRPNGQQQEGETKDSILSETSDVVEPVEVQASEKEICKDIDPKKDETKEAETDNTDPEENGKRELPKGRTKTVCRYFMRGGYCREGEKCRFLHPSHLSRPRKVHLTMTEEQPARKKETSKQPAGTKVVSVEGGRPAVLKPGKKNVEERLSELSERSMKFLQKVEVQRLKKHFARDDLQITKQDLQTICEIKVKPSDPDWPYDVKELQFTVTFPSDYPKKIFEAKIADDGTFPENLSIYINQAIEKYLQEHEAAQQLRDTVDLLMWPFMRWFDRNLESLFTNALKQIKFDVEAKSAGLEFIPFEFQDDGEGSVKTTADANICMCHDMQENYVDTSELENKLNKETIESVTAETESTDCAEGSIDTIQIEKASVMFEMIESKKVSNSKKGAEVRFHGLELHKNTATVQVTSLAFTVQCRRCKNREEIVDVKENKNVSVVCSKCSHVQGIVLTCSEVVHQHSATVGYIDPQGCLPLDLILSRCQMLLGCMNCNKETSIKGISYGYTKNVWCHYCYQKLDLKVDSARFHQLQPVVHSERNTLTTTVKKNAKNKGPPIKIGEPLPNNGTCKHFKKSFRWMRFPCCGKCYPCDECHEENEEHEMEQANRMICGFCSKEQSFTKNGCIACQSFVTARHTTHWEGGKGCRNKLKMSRGDDKKYCDKAKTLSKHATKVENQKKKK